MDRSLFAFIWKHSARQQLMLLVLTVASFPLLYVSLELPKRIINDAIGAEAAVVDAWSMELTQVEYLVLLCLAFLVAVLLSGLMKMRINTLKGVLAERLLRRFRFQLLSRMMRFPKPYFRTTSQGELVSMVTSEAEPMGGLMGDAVAQPVFQAGQMLTILAFLFVQSVWFGLASIALIPLQAWLIPMLQRQINLLNKERIHEVRQFASDIGETAAGISDLRVNGGWRHRLADFTARLGTLFGIRFRIYQKKFFMKFLNNFISQLTPFFFYLVGGYLAIIGEITVGALVAALAAYKDLSAPWKELLTYYNQVQDMSLRWQIVTERFAPSPMIDEALFEGEPATIPHLRGDIVLDDVTVQDADGNTMLEDVSLTIPQGARVAVQSSNAAERAAFADLLTREVLPARGKVTLSGQPLNDLHQAVIAARIGYAHSRPYLFAGTLGDNLLMPLRIRPKAVAASDPDGDDMATEARRAGNSPDPLDAEWTDPGIAGLTDEDEIGDWWFKLVEAMGIDRMMYRRTLRSLFDPARHPDLARRIVALRADVLARLREEGLEDAVYRFDPESFNPAIPLGGNLFFAAPRRQITQKSLAAESWFSDMLHRHDIAEQARDIGQGAVDTLRQTFGQDGTDHPLFRRLGMDEEVFRRLIRIAEKRRSGGSAALTDEESALLITVPFLLTAEQIGPSFPDAAKKAILTLRRTRGAELRAQAAPLFVPIASDTYFPRLTVIENAIYGRIAMTAGTRGERVEEIVAEVLAAHGLQRQIAATIYDMPTALGGANLPGVIQERAAFGRAGIKRPDILILDRALASHDARSREETGHRLAELLPETTLIFMEDRFEHPEDFDMVIEIQHGRIGGVATLDHLAGRSVGAEDLLRKQRVIAGTEMFARLDTRNQRLLAYSAQWYDVPAGQLVFRAGDRADAAYLCLAGHAELRWPQSRETDRPVTVVEPGRVIGDLSIILNQPRSQDLVAVTDARFLRIGAEEYRAVIDADPAVGKILLQTVAGHLVGAASLLRSARVDLDTSGELPRQPWDRLTQHADA